MLSDVTSRRRYWRSSSHVPHGKRLAGQPDRNWSLDLHLRTHQQILFLWTLFLCQNFPTAPPLAILNQHSCGNTLMHFTCSIVDFDGRSSGIKHVSKAKNDGTCHTYRCFSLVNIWVSLPLKLWKMVAVFYPKSLGVRASMRLYRDFKKINHQNSTKSMNRANNKCFLIA